MWLSGELLDRLGIRICFDGVGGASGTGGSSAGGTGSAGDGSSSTGDTSGSSAGGAGETGASDAAASGTDAAQGAPDAGSFSEAMSDAAAATGVAGDDAEAEESAPATCSLGTEGLRDFSDTASLSASLAADVQAVDAATANPSPSQEFSPGDIDPVTNNAVAEVTAQGQITCEIDAAGRALTGNEVAGVQQAAVAAALDPGPAPAQADLTPAGFPDPGGLYTGFVTGLDPARQPLDEAAATSQPAPVAATRSWADDFQDYLADSIDALSRIPGDLQALAQGFIDRPLETTTSLANSFPQTRVAGAGTTLASSLAMALGSVRLAENVAVPSSRALAAALEAAGVSRPAQTAAHHIAAGSAPAAAQARATLARFGIGINDAANGAFLPATRASANPTGAAVHSTLHTNAYYAEVNELLGAARTREEALAVLDVIGRQLLDGGL